MCGSAGSDTVNDTGAPMFKNVIRTNYWNEGVIHGLFNTVITKTVTTLMCMRGSYLDLRKRTHNKIMEKIT
jgi:hypothetical protein